MRTVKADRGQLATKWPMALLTPSDVSELLGISRKGVYRLARSGTLTSVRVGGLLRFSPEDVASYIERRRSKATRRCSR